MTDKRRIGRYVPIAVVAARDPDAVDVIRAREREKRRRMRAADPEADRAAGRRRYANNAAAYVEKKRAWQVANPEKVKVSKKKERVKNRASIMLQSVRYSCKEKGLECDITREWLQERLDVGICEMSGLPFDLDVVGHNQPNKPSIDRKTAGGPYTQANCRMVLWSVNRALCNYGEDYVIGVFAKIIERRSRR